MTMTMTIDHPHHCPHFLRSFGNLAKISPEQQSSARAAASTMGPTMIRGPVWNLFFVIVHEDEDNDDD